MKTRRPADIPFPHVWRRFSRTNKNGETKKFKIQDCPEEMHEEFMEFMIKFFMRDETWNSALGIGDEELAVEEFYKMQSMHLPEKLALVCLADDGVQYDMKTNKPKILGFSLTTVTSKDEPPPDLEIKSKAITKLFEMFHEMEKKFNVFERYNVTEFLGDAGLSVDPECRGFGISKELLLARVELARSLGLKIIEATFTGPISQISAEKCGYETIIEVPYHEFEQQMNFDFKTDNKSIKAMAFVVK